MAFIDEWFLRTGICHNDFMRNKGFSSKLSIHSNCFYKYKAATKGKQFAKIFGEKLEKKKMLNIDILDGKFKKFPDKKNKKE